MQPSRDPRTQANTEPHGRPRGGRGWGTSTPGVVVQNSITHTDLQDEGSGAAAPRETAESRSWEGERRRVSQHMHGPLPWQAINPGSSPGGTEGLVLLRACLLDSTWLKSSGEFKPGLVPSQAN